MRRNHRISRNTARWNKIAKIVLRCVLYALVLFFVSIGGYRSVKMIRYWHKNSVIKEGYVIQVEKLKQEQKALKKHINDLENNPVVLEELARNIGFVKPGEVIYKLENKEK